MEHILNELSKKENRKYRDALLRFVAEYLDNELYVSIARIAKEIGVPRQTLYYVTNKQRSCTLEIFTNFMNVAWKRYGVILERLMPMNVYELKKFLEEREPDLLD